MKKIYIPIFLLLMGCSKDFEDINSNPNAPEEIAPQFLLSNVISEAADWHTYEQGFRRGNYLAQFAASVEFERIDRYEMGSNSDYWNVLYSLQTDIRSMKEASGSNEAYAAVGDVLRVFLSAQLTDLWGDVPYSEAIQARENNYTPVYDAQEDIYLDEEIGLLATLDKASETLATTSAKIEGDVLFANDLEKWERFANSLKIRYLIRVSERIDVSEELKEALSAKLMASNADNAVLPYLSSAPNQWPMSNASLGLFQEHRMTAMVDSMLDYWQDPRVSVLYRPTANTQGTSNPEYQGLMNGLSRESISARNIDLNDISLFGSAFRDVPNALDGQFMQYAELQFAIAEAITRGLVPGDAEEFYEAGIAASFEYWGVELPAGYFEQSSVKLNGQGDLQKILSQKWISLINCGHEAWSLVRRTGIPDLQPGPDNFNADRYPARYLYPESEQATNLENYQSALAQMGPDDINTSVWWQVD